MPLLRQDGQAGMPVLRMQAHALLDGADGAVGDGSDARGAIAQDGGEVGRVGGDLAIALLEGFEVGDDHFGNLFLEVAVAHAGKGGFHGVIALAGEGLGAGVTLTAASPGPIAPGASTLICPGLTYAT